MDGAVARAAQSITAPRTVCKRAYSYDPATQPELIEALA
jgi:hypothetical protein